jgi:hypothetical protein
MQQKPHSQEEIMKTQESSLSKKKIKAQKLRE